MRELLIEKRLIGADEIRRQIEVLDFAHAGARRQGRRARLGRPCFPARLLADGRAACEEFGISFYDDTGLIVLENTDTVHNLIVCTLCSCYPRPVLGLAARLVQAEALSGAGGRSSRGGAGGVRHDHPRRRRDPGQRFDRRWCATWSCRGGRQAPEALTEEQLAALVTRDAMIGVVPVGSEPGAGAMTRPDICSSGCRTTSAAFRPADPAGRP